MPEIKRNFAQGKMNKDFDERLVPRGQYRDAMNIQVSTSEGSDVGTIQNILGNVLISDYFNLYQTFPLTYWNALPNPPITSSIRPQSEFQYAGGIPDEKNDKLYYFLRGGNDIVPPYELKTIETGDYTGDDPLRSYPATHHLRLNGIRVYSDHIMEYDSISSEVKPIFTDNHSIIFDIYNTQNGIDRNFNIYNESPPIGFDSRGFKIADLPVVREIALAIRLVDFNKYLKIGSKVECWSANSGSPKNYFSDDTFIASAKFDLANSFSFATEQYVCLLYTSDAADE